MKSARHRCSKDRVVGGNSATEQSLSLLLIKTIKKHHVGPQVSPLHRWYVPQGGGHPTHPSELQLTLQTAGSARSRPSGLVSPRHEVIGTCANSHRSGYDPQVRTDLHIDYSILTIRVKQILHHEKSLFQVGASHLWLLTDRTSLFSSRKPTAMSSSSTELSRLLSVTSSRTYSHKRALTPATKR